jgi:hypothetical protein
MIVTKEPGLFSEREWTGIKEHLALPPRQAEILRCVLGVCWTSRWRSPRGFP